MKLKFSFIKLILVLFLVLIICTTIYHVYNYFYKAPRTEYAVQVECEDKVSVKGYFVRNESVINSSDFKYYDIIVKNGGKVSKNGTIANVYYTDGAAKIQSEIRDLQIKIDEFKSIIDTASKYREDLSYSSEIKKHAFDISDNIADGNINQAFTAASEFSTSVIKSKIATGEIINFSDRLKELENEMDSLKKQSSSVAKYIKSPESGYFSYKVDGFEDKLNIAFTDEINSEVFSEIEQICQQPVTNTTSIGKVVKGSDWRVCFKADASKLENIQKGKTVYIRLPSVTEDKIKCTVVDFNKSENDIYVVLESNFVTGDLLSQRVCDIEIIVDSYSGIRIDKNAIRKIDGKDGVFVKSNGIVRYREIEILYFSTTFVVVKYDPVNSSGVQIFDEVIVRGTDLYDKKVIG